MSIDTCVRPVPGLECPECKEAWKEGDLGAVGYSDSVAELVPEFVGKTLGEFRTSLRARRDGRYDVDADSQYSNPRLVDMSQEPGRDWPINPHGWYPIPYKKAPFDETHVIVADDKVYWRFSKYYHPECYKKFLEKFYRNYFVSIFKQAGYQKIDLTARGNGYSGDEFASPWFDVTTELGDFTIGWRKRVMNIDWPSGYDFRPLFKNENVTQDATSIHAWTKEKAVFYLSTMLQGRELEKIAYIHES